MASRPQMSPEQMASFQYQQQHFDDDRRSVLIGTSWSLWALATVAIGLRFYAKRIMRSRLSPEDGLVLLGLLATTGLCICSTVGATLGFGLHTIRVNPSNFVMLVKILYSFQIIYNSAILSIKCSILLFYRRTFAPFHGFRIAVWCVAGLVICWYFTVTFSTIFRCTPISFTWNKNISGGHCLNLQKLVLSAAIINIITDFIIVFMPVPVIWKLQMPTTKKIGICCIFFLGGIVILASIFRLTTLLSFSRWDSAYDSVKSGIWSMIEPAVGIVGACLPLMTPLFRRVKEMSTRKSSGAASTGEGGRGWHPIHLENGQRRPSDQYGSNFKDDIPLSRPSKFPDAASSDHDLNRQVRAQPQSPIMRSMDFSVEVTHVR